MGCNCKGRKRIINNLNSVDHLKIAKDVYTRIIQPKQFEELDEYDWIEIYQAYNAVWPMSSQVPSQRDAYDKVIQAVELMKVKYKTHYGTV